MELEEKISALGAKVVLVPNQKRHITERTPSPQSLKIPGIILFIFLLCGVFFAFYSLTKRQMLSEEKVSSYKTPDHQMKDSTFTQPERSLVQKGTGVEGGAGWKNNESGINLFNKGDYEGAISLFEDALYLEPGKREYRNNLSAAFTALGWKKLKGKSYQDAQTFFERAYIYTPEDYNVNKGLGFTKYKLKEFDEAKVFLLEVIDKNPKDMDILGVLGEIFCLQDDIARANEYLEKIKIIDPSSLTATILEEELKSKKTQTTFAPH